ncbi:MAG: hypothetical protein JJ863_04220 [Deltaproteobacteria bacterium]|nr:hypothetical protein [Deltaproteobacteria bacterium]
MSRPVGDALEEALAILRPVMDVLVERPADGLVPAWVSARGWEAALLGLSDDALHAAERSPARWLAAHASGSLRELAERADVFVAGYRFADGEADADDRTPRTDADGREPRTDADDREPTTDSETDADAPRAERRPRHVKARKQAQIDAFVAAAAELTGVERVVDLGSGHGHLTRALGGLAAAIGVEREPSRAARARELGGEFIQGEGARARLRPGDLAVGLHPCGALGDDLVRSARGAGARVLMVSCCYQKTPPPSRQWLSERAEGFSLSRDALGLANLSPISFPGSGTLGDKRRWRRTRLALRLALEARGEVVGPGDEARGVTKERFARGLRAAADRAYERRGLTPASDAELDQAREAAARIHGRVARFALPRHALARVLELAIVLDRAAFLAEGGMDARVRPLFDLATSPRNLAVVAQP